MENQSKEERFLIKAIIVAIGITIIGNFIFTFWLKDWSSWFQDFAPLLGFIPFILLPVLIVLYLIAVGKRLLNSRTDESKTTVDIHAKMALLNESMGRIEKKLDKIENILEKVSE